MKIDDIKTNQTIKLLSMDNDPNPITIGSLGVITRISKLPFDEEFQIDVQWHNGRTLSLIFPFDKFEIIKD